MPHPRKVIDTAEYTNRAAILQTHDSPANPLATNKHPTLIVRYVGYLAHGYTFRFMLEGFAELLDDQVDSACWDSFGNLVYSRDGFLKSKFYNWVGPRHR